MNTTDVIKKAKSFCKRRPTAKQKQGILHYLATQGPNGVSRFGVSVKPNFDTACWSIGNWQNGRYHKIEVGSDFNQPCKPNVRFDEKQMKQFCESLIRHEACHGLHTDHNLPAVGQACAAKGVPFSLFNLFEDGRIEHIERERTKAGQNYQRFRWTRWLDHPTESDNPRHYLWSLINKEASSFSAATTGAPTPVGKLTTAQTRRIRNYYYASLLKAAGSGEIIELCVEWMREFPETGFGADHPRMTVWIGGDRDPAADPTATDIDNAGHHPDGVVVEDNSRAELESFQGENNRHRAEWNYQPTKEAVRQLTQRLAGLVANAGRSPMRTATTGSRLHMPNVVGGSANSFRTMGTADGVRTITLLVDCSRSMGPQTQRIRDALAFMHALRALHKQGILRAHVWLTSRQSRCRLNPAWSAAAVGDIIADHLGEGVRATLQQPDCARDIAESSLAVVYTDAELMDGAINSNQWRNAGTDLVGAVTWNGSMDDDAKEFIRSGMRKHFAKWFVADTPNQLAGELVNYALRK